MIHYILVTQQEYIIRIFLLEKMLVVKHSLMDNLNLLILSPPHCSKLKYTIYFHIPKTYSLCFLAIYTKHIGICIKKIS